MASRSLAEQHGANRRDFYFVTEDVAGLERVARAAAEALSFPLAIERRSLAEVAPIILPYLKDRPESLNRYPDGISGNHFFQKDVEAIHLPPFVEMVKIPSESEGEFMAPICQNEEGFRPITANTELPYANERLISTSSEDSTNYYMPATRPCQIDDKPHHHEQLCPFD